MLRRFFQPLYQRTPVRFVSDFPLEKSITRLRERTKRSASGVGVVSEDKVKLRRSIPFFHNSYQPTFVGRFSTDRNRTVLEGYFTISRSTKILMTILLGFALLWTLLSCLFALVIALKPDRSAQELPTLFMPLVGVPLIGLGWLGARLGQRLSRGDVAFLSSLIEQALRADPHAHAKHGR